MLTNKKQTNNMQELQRYDLLNYLIKKYKYETYLEIGTQHSTNGSKVECKSKSGIDPKPIKRADNDFNSFYNMTSDKYFAKHKDIKYDIIFIDGLHTHAQSLDDFNNSVQMLNPKGCIVLHDCLPDNKEYCSINWCGTVYQTLHSIVEANYNTFVFDFDHGCTVVFPTQLKEIGTNNELTYEQHLIELGKVKVVKTFEEYESYMLPTYDLTYEKQLIKEAKEILHNVNEEEKTIKVKKKPGRKKKNL